MDYTPIINAAIALIAALISAFLIPWLKKKISAEKLDAMERLIRIAVEAAEQSGASPAEKKKAVMDFLESKGYNLDETVLNAIEAAVLRLHTELYGEWTKDDGN